MYDNRHDIAILLGAGSSAPAGFPSTEKLTNLVLSGDGVRRHTSGSYIIDPNAPNAFLDNRLNFVKFMIQWFYEEVKQYWSTRPWLTREINYEDLFYVAKQASNDEWEVENPAVRIFIDRAKAYINSIDNEREQSISPYSTFVEACNYIADIVARKLSQNPSNEEHLKLIDYVCKNFNVRCIATLCHDIHVEKFLRDKKILFTDGFFDHIDGVRYWNGDFSSNGKISFIKLHGSINWFRFLQSSQIAMLHNTPDLDRRRADDFYRNVDERAEILIGTFNKISDYSRSIFLDIFCNFRYKINTADTMIICGYSFGDKGVNGEIVNWHDRNPHHRRFIVIHPNPKKLFENARGAIKNRLDEWSMGKLIIIPEYLQNVNTEDILTAITSP